MKKLLNLGRALLLLPAIIYAASVNAYVDSKTVAKNQKLTFTIEASGDSVEFPNIVDINSSKIVDRLSSTSLRIINGNYTKTQKREYKIVADSNFTIPSYSVIVDGKEYKTKPIDIVVSNSAIAKAGAAKVELEVEKKEAYVGEPIDLRVKIYLPKDILKYQIVQPKMKDFWVKEASSPTKRVVANGAVIEYKFLITPQKSGKLELGPIAIDVAKMEKSKSNPFGDDEFFNIFTQSLRWEKIYSNKLEFNVLPLPQNLEVAGDFDFEVNANKTKIQAGKPVNLTIKIKGEGNLEDIKKFSLDIPEAVVYADDPKVTTNIVNGKEVGEFVQKIAVVADSNVTIKPLEFRYFDLNKKEVVIKKSKPIDIVVLGAKRVETASKISSSKTILEPKQTIKSSANIKEDSSSQSGFKSYIYFVIGFVLGAFVVYLLGYKRADKKVKKEKPIVKKIKSAKSDKELFSILLPYAKSSSYIAEILQKREANIYKNGKNSIDKSKIIEYFEDEIE